jgi:hypothetical protein
MPRIEPSRVDFWGKNLILGAISYRLRGPLLKILKNVHLFKNKIDVRVGVLGMMMIAEKIENSLKCIESHPEPRGDD